MKCCCFSFLLDAVFCFSHRRLFSSLLSCLTKNLWIVIFWFILFKEKEISWLHRFCWRSWQIRKGWMLLISVSAASSFWNSCCHFYHNFIECNCLLWIIGEQLLGNNLKFIEFCWVFESKKAQINFVIQFQKSLKYPGENKLISTQKKSRNICSYYMIVSFFCGSLCNIDPRKNNRRKMISLCIQRENR